MSRFSRTMRAKFPTRQRFWDRLARGRWPRGVEPRLSRAASCNPGTLRRPAVAARTGCGRTRGAGAGAHNRGRTAVSAGVREPAVGDWDQPHD